MKLIRNLLLGGVLFASGAFANNLLTNGSFESGTFVDTSGGCGGDSLPAGSTAMTGWTVIATTGPVAWLANGGACYGGVAAQGGTMFLDLTGITGDASPFGGVQQTVDGLAAGNYALTFYLGYLGTGAAGGPVSAKVTVGTQPSVEFTSGSGGTGNVWTLETLDFSIATAGNYTVSLAGVYSAGHTYIGLDNLDLEFTGSGVPEPAMSIPIALAGVFFVLSRRKRARQ